MEAHETQWVCLNLSANAGGIGDAGLIPGSERSLEEEMATHPSILPRESYGQRSLSGFSPWGPKELDMTEHEKKKEGTILNKNIINPHNKYKHI